MQASRAPVYWRSCDFQPRGGFLLCRPHSSRHAHFEHYREHMDELLLNTGALSLMLTAFRDLIEYYLVSPDCHATETRSQLRSSTSGGGLFLSSLCQDLDDICAYCRQADSRKGWDDSARSDIRHVLTCLSNLIVTTNPSEVSSSPLMWCTS
jgi:hypothetical protein